MELRYCPAVADRVYIPVQPTQFNLVTLEQMDRLVDQAQALNPRLESLPVMNRASTNPSVTDVEESRDLVGEFDCLGLVHTILRERVAYQITVGEDLSIVEVCRPDIKALEEIRSLYGERC